MPITPEEARLFIRDHFALPQDAVEMLAQALEGQPNGHVLVCGLSLALLGATKSNMPLEDLVVTLRALDELNRIGLKLEEQQTLQKATN